MNYDAICRIDKNRHDQLDMGTYNPALNGMKNTTDFTDEFKTEIRVVDKLFFDFFNKYGESGSYDRYCAKKPSDTKTLDSKLRTSGDLAVCNKLPQQIIDAAEKTLIEMSGTTLGETQLSEDIDNYS